MSNGLFQPACLERLALTAPSCAHAHMALPATTSAGSAAARRVTRGTAVSRVSAAGPSPSHTLPYTHTIFHVTLFSVYLQLACQVPTASTVIRCVSARRGTSCATQCQERATVLRATRDPNVIWVKLTTLLNS